MSLARPRSGLVELATRPLGWVVLVAVALVALGVGSVHAGPTSRVARIADLENIIKCPACAGISIAQSDAQSAAGLRYSVVRWVDEGWSDERIEDYVAAKYGSAEILRPTNAILWLLPIVVGSLAVVGVAVTLIRHRRPRPFGTLSPVDEELVRVALEERR